MSDDPIIPAKVRKLIYGLAIPANAFIVAVGWSGNRWILGILAALNAGGFSVAAANVSQPKGGGEG